MDKRALALQLLAELGETLTVGPITLDEATQSCMLLFDGNLLLNIEYDDSTGRLVLSCYLHELPDHDAEPLLRELMAANLYGHRTRGAVLGLEEETGGVILSYAHSVVELDGAGFETLIENFVNQAEKWKRVIAEALSGEGDGDRSAEAGSAQASAMVFG